MNLSRRRFLYLAGAAGATSAGALPRASAQAYPALRMLVLPHPMESRPEREVRALAAARFAELVGLLAESV